MSLTPGSHPLHLMRMFLGKKENKEQIWPALLPPPHQASLLLCLVRGRQCGRCYLTCSSAYAQEPAGILQSSPEYLQIHNARARTGSQEATESSAPKAPKCLVHRRLRLPTLDPCSLGLLFLKPDLANTSWSRCE